MDTWRDDYNYDDRDYFEDDFWDIPTVSVGDEEESRRFAYEEDLHEAKEPVLQERLLSFDQDRLVTNSPEVERLRSEIKKQFENVWLSIRHSDGKIESWKVDDITMVYKEEKDPQGRTIPVLVPSLDLSFKVRKFNTGSYYDYQTYEYHIDFEYLCRLFDRDCLRMYIVKSGKERIYVTRSLMAKVKVYLKVDCPEIIGPVVDRIVKQEREKEEMRRKRQEEQDRFDAERKASHRRERSDIKADKSQSELKDFTDTLGPMSENSSFSDLAYSAAVRTWWRKNPNGISPKTGEKSSLDVEKLKRAAEGIFTTFNGDGVHCLSGAEIARTAGWCAAVTKNFKFAISPELQHWDDACLQGNGLFLRYFRPLIGDDGWRPWNGVSNDAKQQQKVPDKNSQWSVSAEITASLTGGKSKKLKEETPEIPETLCRCYTKHEYTAFAFVLLRKFGFPTGDWSEGTRASVIKQVNTGNISTVDACGAVQTVFPNDEIAEFNAGVAEVLGTDYLVDILGEGYIGQPDPVSTEEEPQQI